MKVPADSVPEFELEDTAEDIQWRREALEREEAQQWREKESRREEVRIEESHSQEEEVAEKTPRTERSATESEAAGGQGGPLQSQYKKGT